MSQFDCDLFTWDISGTSFVGLRLLYGDGGRCVPFPLVVCGPVRSVDSGEDADSSPQDLALKLEFWKREE
jgi:hypothetical protein